MILEIERLWGEQPGWFATLSHDRRRELHAWYRVLTNPHPDK